MTQDELNQLLTIRATLGNALVQANVLNVRLIADAAMKTLDDLIQANTKANEPVGDYPCPVCNSNGVFKFSPVKNCICGGKAWLHSLSAQ